MLDVAALRAIDWASLSHAYGPAIDVPSLIEAVATGDADNADDAISELYGTIAHQGSRYSATVTAISFLIDLACDPNGRHRTATIELIRFCAMGNLGPALDAETQRRHQTGPHEAACWDATVRDHARLEPLLVDADPAVAGAALTLLAWTGDTAPAVLGHVADRTSSSSAEDRLAGHLASTVLGVHPTTPISSTPEGIDRFGWAASAIRFLADDCPPSAVDELCRSFSNDRVDLAGSPFFVGEDPAQLSIAALSALPPSLLDHASQELIRAMDQGWARGVDALATFLRAHLGSPDPTAVGRLSTRQVDAIRTLLPALERWNTSQPLWELGEYGLPTSANDLSQWLKLP